MRFTILAICLLWVYIPTASSTDDFGVKIVQFDMEYNKWSREYFGCPPEGEVSIETCKPYRAKMDYDAYKRTRKRAMALFDLAEKPHDK